MLGPNDLLPCPSPSARRRHAARTHRCRTCDPIRSVEEAAQIRLAKEAQILHALLADVDRSLAALQDAPSAERDPVGRLRRRLLLTLKGLRRTS